MNTNFKRFISSLLIVISIISSKVPLAFAEPKTSNADIDNNTLKEDIADSKEEFELILKDLFNKRNRAILTSDTESLKSFYDFNIKTSLWAYESECKKVQYLKNWCEKQAVNFNDITCKVYVKSLKKRDANSYGMCCAVASTFDYSYVDSPDIHNKFRLGTTHYLNIRKSGDIYTLTKEWYTDPFADSLDLGNIKSDSMREFILSSKAMEITLTDRAVKAMEYAHKYCGVSEDAEYLFKYNNAYTDFNPEGGDCANFASQILHEGGGFKQSGAWTYRDSKGSKAWVNAQGFKNYMVHSGRASYVAKGSYEEVYKAAYNMKPGDFVAYEKKGKIVHISTVTGMDSKGYPLVTCHNTDRLLVPYDLGWSNSNIKFHLLHVHY